MIWDSFHQAINSPQISIEGTIFKLFLSLLAGGLVGLNREKHKQPAGFRTHILICLGSTLLMILSIYIPQVYFDFKNGDPGRIAAQVVSGIGFLGAGAIIRLGTNIRGLTTAASIWLISAVGLSIGAGLYIISFVTVIFALFTLAILENAERRLIPPLNIKTIALEFDSDNFPETQIKKILKKNDIHLSDYSLSNTLGKDTFTEYKMIVKIPEKAEIAKLVDAFQKLDSIKSVKID